MRNFQFNESILNRNENIDRYRADIAKYATMGDNEVKILVKKAQNGNASALNKVVESNLKIVWSIAKHYQNLGLDFEDLVQEGNIGLIAAVHTFDFNKGTMFTTWVLQRVVEHINIALTDKSRVVRMNLQQIKDKRNYGCKSMDAPLESDDNEDKTFGDTFASDSRADSITRENDIKMEITLLMQGLTDRERAVVCGLFGIGTTEESEYTLSIRYDITEERIRQIKWEALKKMKGFARK